jgi:serine protease Do
MDGLVTHGHVIRGYLGVGIQDVTPGLAKAFKLKEDSGALVSDVSPASPASKAGIADGDVIVEFQGKIVAGSRQLKMMVAETQPGATVPVKIIRQDETRTLQVKVGELPGETSAIHASTTPAEDTDTLKGVSVDDLNADNHQQYEVPDKIHGALVTGVEEDSAASRAGLKPGDVILSLNNQEVKNSADAVRLTEHAKDRNTLVRVWSKAGTHFLAVDETREKNG